MKSNIENLIAKLEFWYARKFIKLDTHYTFFLDINGSSDSFAIKFLKKYENVIVEFTNVKIGNDSQMTFDYDIIANPNNCDVKSKGFARFTSNVMRSMIYNAVENAQRIDNENRNTDIVKSDSERTVHEEVVAVSEKRVSNRKPRKKTVRRNKAIHSEIQQSTTDGSVGNQS